MNGGYYASVTNKTRDSILKKNFLFQKNQDQWDFNTVYIRH